MLQILVQRIDACNRWIGETLAWLTLAMVTVTFAIVMLRYAFNVGWIAMQESVTYLHALLFMLCAAYTLGQDGHVRVDIFYRRLGDKGRAWVDLFGTLLLLMPVCLYIAWSSWDYVVEAWRIREASREAGGLPWLYVLKSTIPTMAGLMFLQGIAQLLRNILIITQAPPSH